MSEGTPIMVTMEVTLAEQRLIETVRRGHVREYICEATRWHSAEPFRIARYPELVCVNHTAETPMELSLFALWGELVMTHACLSVEVWKP